MSGTRQRGSGNLSNQKPNVLNLPDGTRAEWKVSKTRATLDTDKLNVFVGKVWSGPNEGKFRAEGFLNPPEDYKPSYVPGVSNIGDEPNYIGRYTDTLEQAMKGAQDWIEFQHDKKR